MLITPKTKIGELLETYPQLEDKLLDLSPSYSKLRNPIIRKTIGRVATLQQVAVIGNFKVEDLVNILRKEVGQNEFMDKVDDNNSTEKPNWFDSTKIVKTLDVRDQINKGESPMSMLLSEIKQLKENQIIEFITPFLPAPIIEKIEEMGFSSWSKKESKNVFKNYSIKH